MSRVLLVIRAMVWVVFAAAIASPTAAFAQPADTQCGALLVDGADVLPPAGEKQVLKAAQALERNGAQVRVRTEQSVPDGNVDRFERTLENRCVGWQSADGGRKNNLLVVIVSIGDRQTGIYYGAEFSDELDGRWLKVQSDVMNPRFRDGEFAKGLAGGVRRLGELMFGEPAPDRNEQPPTTTPKPPSRPRVRVVDRPPVVPEETEPLTVSPAVWVLLGAAVVLVIAIVVGRRLWQRRQELHAARDAASARKRTAAESFLHLEQESATTVLSADAMIQHVGEQLSADLRALRSTAGSAINAANASFSDAGDGPDPDTPLAIADAQRAEAAYSEAGTAIQAARDAVAALAAAVTRLESLRATLPETIEAAVARIGTAREAGAQVQAAGYRIDHATALLDLANDTFVSATAALERHDYDAAEKAVNGAEAHLLEADQWLQDLPALAARLRDAQRALGQRLLQADRGIDEARVVFDRVSEKYAASTWRSVRGNGSEAEALRTDAMAAVAAAGEALADDRQDWNAAQAAIDGATQMLDRCDALTGAIVSLEQSLIEEERTVAADVEAAQADVDTARRFLEQHDPDVTDTLNPEPARAQTMLDAARDELAKDKPDYFEVARLAREANDLADRVLAQARSEHEAAERLRAVALQWMREASAALSRAQGYIDSNRWTVRSHAEELLADADRLYRLAYASKDPNEQITIARDAHTRATDAYEEAKEDVRAERHQSSAFGVGVGAGSLFGGHSSGGFGGSSFGDSSFDGGGFDGGGGGGGSSDFGSSGDGGGGSSGW